MVELIPVDQKSVRKVWNAAMPFLAKSYARSGLEVPSDLLAELCWGKRKLWLIVDAPKEEIIGAGITAIYELSKERMLKIEHLSGTRMREWVHLRSVIESFAKAHDCGKVLHEARRGWERLLPDYQVTAVIMEKRL